MGAALKSTIVEVLGIWNQNVKAQGINIEYQVEVRNRVKNFYTTKTKFFTKDIAELLFISKGEDENLLLWRKEIEVPKKVTGVQKHIVRSSIEDNLYKYFLHECIGTFGVICSQSITNQDYAPYDLVKDRMDAHPSYKDHVIEVIEDGAFYEKGDTFDVFNKLDGGWGVYTQHDVGVPNGGIAKIDSTKCKVIQETAQKIELYTPPIPKIQLIK